jgi:hypothetical protein
MRVFDGAEARNGRPSIHYISVSGRVPPPRLEGEGPGGRVDKERVAKPRDSDHL